MTYMECNVAYMVRMIVIVKYIEL